MWVQCLACYAGVVTANQPERVPDLLAYLIQIVKASLDFDGSAWATYDGTFRRQAAAIRGTQWSRLNPSFFSMCFTGKARSSTQCKRCFSTNHETRGCSSLQEFFSNPPAGGGQANVDDLMSGNPSAWPICRRFNETRCTCRCRHICMRCQGVHPVLDCGSQRRTGKAGFKTGKVRQNRYYPY